MFKKKYIAMFMIKEQGTFNILVKKRFKPSVNKISFREKMFPIRIDNPSYSKGLALIYCFNFDSGKQLNFIKGKPSNMDLKFLNKMVSKDLMKKFTSEMTGKSFKDKLFDMILGGLIGGSITFIIAGFIFGGFAV